MLVRLYNIIMSIIIERNVNEYLVFVRSIELDYTTFFFIFGFV